MSAIFALLQNLARANWLKPDPGNGVTFTADEWALYKIVTAGTETMTLVAPYKEGILIGFEHMTDGGVRTIAVGVPVSDGGSNTNIILTDVRESIWLISVPTATGFRWQVFANNGATFS